MTEKLRKQNKFKEDISRTSTGISVFGETVHYILKSPSILLYFLLCLVLTLLVFAGIFFLGYWGYGFFDEWVMHFFSNPESFWAQIVSWLVYIPFFLVYLLFFIFSFSLIGEIVCLPLMDLLSSKVEKLAWDRFEEAPFWDAVKRGMLSALKAGIRQILAMILAIPLIFIPVVGIIAYFLINAWFIAFGYLDFPMARRGWTYEKKKIFFKGFWKSRLIFGSILYAGFMIPFINLMMVPAGTIAATILFIRISQDEKKNELANQNSEQESEISLQ